MSKKNLIAIGALFFILLAGIFVTIYLLGSNQDTRSNASTGSITDTSGVPVSVQDGSGSTCTDPGVVQNVTVNYPNITETESDFNSANCAWDANSNAANYHVKITNVDTEAVVDEKTLTPDQLTLAFPVSQKGTYRCEVAAVNSCNVAGTAGFDQQVCGVDAMLTETPSPTAPPIVTEAPTATPTAIVTQAPTVKPTLPPTGSIGTIATVGVGGIILMLIGGALLFW